MTKYPAVLATDADTALLALRLRGAQAAYQRRLHHLLNKPAT